MSRTLGIDYGDVRVGLAISDELGSFAGGLPTITRKANEDGRALINKIEAVCKEYGVTDIVLGLPIGQNAALGKQAEKVLSFKEKLQKKLANALPRINIVTRDERFTTSMANRLLDEADMSHRKRVGAVDRMAACIILQDYLDEQRRNTLTTAAGKEEININPENNEPTIRITDDTGIDIEFVVVDEVEKDGTRYLLVVEEENIDDDEAEAVIFKETGSDGDELLYEELTDDEFDVVAGLFSERLKDYDIEY